MYRYNDVLSNLNWSRAASALHFGSDFTELNCSMVKILAMPEIFELFDCSINTDTRKNIRMQAVTFANSLYACVI